MLLNEFLNYFMAIKAPMLAPNTVSGYKRNIAMINEHIGNKPIEQIKAIDIQQMYIKMQETLSGTTVLYVHRVLKQAFKYALMQDIIQRDVSAFVIAPKKSRHKNTILSYDDAMYLLSECIGTELYAPVAFALLLGLRRGEMLGLKYSDFNEKRYTLSISRSAIFKNGERVLSDTKTESGVRTLLLSKELFYELRDCTHNESGFICDMTQSVLQRRFSAKLAEIGLPHMRYHDLRHTCATLLILDNVPSKVVSNRLGHSKVSTTLDIYTHVSVDMQVQAAVAFDSLIADARAVKSKGAKT